MTELIAGVDEVGRGAWAGPIVAAAVILGDPINGLNDSKQLSALSREKLDQIIRTNAISFAIAELSATEIDRLGIAEANRLVMRMAIEQLSTIPHLVRVDGFSCRPNLPEQVIIKGDSLLPEIMAASIIAKVYRDNLMHQLHLTEPRFGFHRHVGYGTKHHRRMLDTFGPSPWHRMSFRPMSVIANEVKQSAR